MALDYKKAGVDIDAGEALVDWIKSTQPKAWPHQENLVSGIGGFSALFRADFKSMSEPCLVSSTDGVGTKLLLASHFKNYSTVGQDLVAMCVNDLICCGAQPLFFLDYYACGKLQLDVAKEFLTGVKEACIASDCALIGGETAEMPGVYSGNDFDCAGFSVGVVDKLSALGADKVQSGDVLLGIESSGFHSNGYSLLRQVFAEDLDLWRDQLLKPTHLYVKLIMSLIQKVSIHAIANITGGGLDNILRVVPKQTKVNLKPWSLPSEFMEVKQRSEMSWPELLRTLNCGLGMVLVLPPDQLSLAQEHMTHFSMKTYEIGHVQLSNSEKTEWHLDFNAMEDIN